MKNENENEKVIDNPLELTPENIEKVKSAIADEVREEAGISEEQSDEFKKMLDEALMPVEFLDKDFKLGNNELDIRKLSKANKEQMFFRTLVLHSVYLKNIVTSLVDLTRLLMVLLDHEGISNIVKATDDIIVKITEQNQALKNIYNQTKNKKNN